MAWIKVTSFSSGVRYCINTDKLITFGRPEGEDYTNLWEPGDSEKDAAPRRVRETPDELLALIREAEGVGCYIVIEGGADLPKKILNILKREGYRPDRDTVRWLIEKGFISKEKTKGLGVLGFNKLSKWCSGAGK